MQVLYQHLNLLIANYQTHWCRVWTKVAQVYWIISDRLDTDLARFSFFYQTTKRHKQGSFASSFVRNRGSKNFTDRFNKVQSEFLKTTVLRPAVKVF